MNGEVPFLFLLPAFILGVEINVPNLAPIFSPDRPQFRPHFYTHTFITNVYFLC